MVNIGRWCDWSLPLFFSFASSIQQQRGEEGVGPLAARSAAASQLRGRRVRWDRVRSE